MSKTKEGIAGSRRIESRRKHPRSAVFFNTFYIVLFFIVVVLRCLHARSILARIWARTGVRSREREQCCVEYCVLLCTLYYILCTIYMYYTCTVYYSVHAVSPQCTCIYGLSLDPLSFSLFLSLPLSHAHSLWLQISDVAMADGVHWTTLRCIRWPALSILLQDLSAYLHV